MSQTTPKHWPQNNFPSIGGSLHIGNKPVQELAKSIGTTPFYAYDRKIIDQRISMLRENIPKTIKLHYAVKANPMPELVQHMASLVNGLDIASLGELECALDTLIQPHQISFTGPGKGINELIAAIKAGVTINAESETELVRIIELAEVAEERPRVTIRVNPDFELKSSGMLMGGGAKQFGIDAEQVPGLLKRLGKVDFELIGFHIFSGSQNLNASAIIESQNEALKLAIQLSEYAPSPVRLINLGGGFGIPYFPGDMPLELAPIGENLEELCHQASSALPQAELAIELGRYLVGEAGVYVCSIIDKKISRGQIFLITDGGMHHHLAASGNFGQIVRKNYPVVIGNKMAESDREIATVTGRLCTPLDILADKMELPKAEIGDFVVILQSGAYGLSASPTAFLSHPRPHELLI